MAWRLLPDVFQQIVDTNGNPAVGYTIESYLYNTSTPSPLATDGAGSGQATSFTLNSRGAPQSGAGAEVSLYADTSVAAGYKFVLKDAIGATVRTYAGPVWPTFSSADSVDGAYGSTTIEIALDSHRVPSMSALVTGTWTGISEIQTLGFYAGTYKGAARFYHDGTTGGTPTTNTTAAIIAAMATGKVISADGRGWVLSQQEYNIMQFGAGTGVDDTSAIQALADYLNSLGGGKMTAPEGSFLASRIKLYSKVTFEGAGYGTLFTQLGSTSGDFIYNNANTDQFIQIKNMLIDGNKAGQSSTNAGIYLDGGGVPSTFGDHEHIIENVIVINTKGHGIQLINGVREAKFANVRVHGADRRGFSLGCTDCQFVNITSGSSGEEGIYFGGANNRMATSKAFSAGRLVANSPGVKLDSSSDRCSLVAVEAQDNDGHGFELDGCEAPNMAGCIADSNGVGAVNTAGVRLNNVSGGKVDVIARNRSGKTTQEYGAAIGGTTAGVEITGDLTGNNTADYTYTATGINTIPNRIVGTVSTTDATPSVLGYKYLVMTPGAANTITNLDDGHPGQEVIITFGDNNTTFDFTANANMVGNSGADYSPTTGHMVIARRRGSVWYCECIKGS